jgi:nitrate reductase assembly molybdenum cofactor insertion protein NarJ
VQIKIKVTYLQDNLQVQHNRKHNLFTTFQQLDCTGLRTIYLGTFTFCNKLRLLLQYYDLKKKKSAREVTDTTTK